MLGLFMNYFLVRTNKFNKKWSFIRKIINCISIAFQMLQNPPVKITFKKNRYMYTNITLDLLKYNL